MLSRELLSIGKWYSDVAARRIKWDIDKLEDYLCATEIDSLMNNPNYKLKQNVKYALSTLYNQILRGNSPDKLLDYELLR